MLRPKTFAIALIVGLLSTACGGPDPLQGEAVRVAVQSGQFCDEAYSDVWGDFAPDALRPDNAQDFAVSIEQVLETIPDDAPRDLRRVYETYEEIAVLSIDLPIGDLAELDAVSQRRYQDILAAVDELAGFDQDVVSSYVASACPAQYASRGFLTTGSAGQSHGSNGAETAASQNATAAVAPTPEPTPEPTPIPATTTELDIALNVGRYDGADIELLAAQATNATPESLLAGDPVADPDGQNWLVIQVGLTNTFTDQLWLPNGTFRLIGPDGRPAVEADRLDDRGRGGAFSSVGTREFVDGFLAFPTNELVSDLTDWVFVIQVDDGVPEVVPLATDYTRQYPFELASGGAGIILQAVSVGCESPNGTWEAEVTEASLGVDPLNGSGTRVPSGERWMTVRLLATNTGPLSGDAYCDAGITYGSNVDLRLAIDGRSTGNIGGFDYNAENIDIGESTTMLAIFRVDTGASTVALITGPDNDVIVEWQVDIPLILDR